ncbi:MAG: DEAD/DEAH box helicase [Clostridium sp.]|nr:DEAD/DEAH box helicase [Clostridium sp.]
MNDINFKDFGLSEEILKTIDKLGYSKPSIVQQKVIPLILENKDVMVKSQTGSGKTASFAIPICEKIELLEKKPQALVLSPTRELALQIKEDFKNIGRYKRIRCTAVFGKESSSIQKSQLRQRVHVVVGTPGRTIDHIESGNLDVTKIKYIVIDEADEMLSMGFIDQIQSILKRLPKKRIMLLFSATMPEKIIEVGNKYMKDPVEVEIEDKNSNNDRIEQFYYEVDESDKFELLEDIFYVKRPDSAMIFCSTRNTVEEVFNKMKDIKLPVKCFHGGMLQEDRIDVMNRFKKGEFPFLICTDIAARGIDVDNIDYVINYDIPVETENYIHRIGRTGRFGKTGTAVSFITEYQHSFLQSIEDKFNFNIKKGEIIDKEEAQKGRKILAEKLKVSPKLKELSSSKLNSDITKLYINAGKKKKIRPGDIAGAISSIEGVNGEDVGIIDIQDSFSYVEILSGKGDMVLRGLKDKTIKGKNVRIQKAKK